MSATLIAVVLALFLGHVVTPLSQLRRYGWFERWLAVGQRHASNLFASPLSILLSLGIPLLIVAWIQVSLDLRFFGLPGFLFSVAVLIYCWGPRDLDLDVDAVEEAPDQAARDRALSQLAGGDISPAANDEESLVTAVFSGARRRWFGVLLWFLFLGPCGALLYRLSERGARAGAAEHLPPRHATAYQRLLILLDWPVAHLMTLALGIAGNFDAVYRAWRTWHHARKGHTFDFSVGFLDAAAQTSVRQVQRDDFSERQLDTEAGIEATDHPSDAASALGAMHIAMALVWRILIAWIVVVALFVLAGYV